VVGVAASLAWEAGSGVDAFGTRTENPITAWLTDGATKQRGAPTDPPRFENEGDNY